MSSGHSQLGECATFCLKIPTLFISRYRFTETSLNKTGGKALVERRLWVSPPPPDITDHGLHARRCSVLHVHRLMDSQSNTSGRRYGHSFLIVGSLGCDWLSNLCEGQCVGAGSNPGEVC